jgi:hypothetical protein
MLRALIGTTMIAGTVIAIGASHAPGMKLTGYSAGASCSSTTITLSPPNAPGPWLDISASGLQPSKWYSVFAVTPGGQTEGVAVYAGATGYLWTTSLAAPSAGTYQITVNRFHTPSEVTGCSLGV